jgi:DNA phosphorothioation-associated putative methyltransferase
MDVEELRTAITGLTFGKRLPTAIYVWDQAGEYLPPILRTVCAELRRRLNIGSDANILKFHSDQPKISFLSYPRFFEDPHPALATSVIVNLATGQVRHDSYVSRANPPILHRKESFLPPDHPAKKRFAALTKSEEEAGLLTETSRIGFRLNWDRLLCLRGFAFEGHHLVTTTSDAPTVQSTDGSTALPIRIDRHRTALARAEISKPTKTLLEYHQLRAGESFFDYGCGLGADVRALGSMGYAASGWDPNHAPDDQRLPADVVNLGFVLNVIEDPAERVEVLSSAWALARRLLVVATLICGQEAYSNFQCFGDGVLTSRNTFQKYFEPAEIQSLIEDAIGCEAVPVAMGIYFVFRNVSELQDFLSARTQRFIDWEALSHRLGLRRVLRQRTDPYDGHKELLDEFWQTTVDLGRVPREDEFNRLADVRIACGSLPKAMALFVERFGQETFDAARGRRREDTLVYVAAGCLRKRVPFTKLSPKLQRDIQSFFGSFPEAERKALDVLFAAGDVDELALAVQQLGFGWWDAAEQQFTVHRSLLDELPAIMRVYVECAARLFGNPHEVDLIKFHLRSRKLTFQLYDDFDGAPFPELKLRIKIDLPKLFVTVLEQRHVQDRQILYFKERFLGTDYPGRRKMEQVSKRLRLLGFDPNSIGHGPSREEFEALINQHQLTWSLTKHRVARAP